MNKKQIDFLIKNYKKELGQVLGSSYYAVYKWERWDRIPKEKREQLEAMSVVDFFNCFSSIWQDEIENRKVSLLINLNQLND